MLRNVSARNPTFLFFYCMGGSQKHFLVNLLLILNSERENAGLNVTCASRVFLVESVVHHGFEVQGTCHSLWVMCSVQHYLSSYCSH